MPDNKHHYNIEPGYPLQDKTDDGRELIGETVSQG
jgi:hypothetical protein